MFKHVIALTVLAAATAAVAGTPSKPGTELYFVTPQDGAALSAPVSVVIGLRGMGVAPAAVEWPNTGHHHILINRPFTAEDEEFALEKNDQIIHLGGGQTEATLDLPPGTHTLQLVLGDHGHVPHDPPVVSDVISVTVE